MSTFLSIEFPDSLLFDSLILGLDNDSPSGDLTVSRDDDNKPDTVEERKQYVDVSTQTTLKSTRCKTKNTSINTFKSPDAVWYRTIDFDLIHRTLIHIYDVPKENESFLLYIINNEGSTWVRINSIDVAEC